MEENNKNKPITKVNPEEIKDSSKIDIPLPPSWQTNIVVQEAKYSGPIPPASELSSFEKIIPGAADRILVMAEKNQQHQMEMDNKILNATRREARRGQMFAVIVTLAAFGTAITSLILGYPTTAGIIGGTTVVSLAIAFITGRKSD